MPVFYHADICDVSISRNDVLLTGGDKRNPSLVAGVLRKFISSRADRGFQLVELLPWLARGQLPLPSS